MPKAKTSIAIALMIFVLELTLFSGRTYPATDDDPWSDLTDSLTAGLPIEVDEINHTKIKGTFVGITSTSISLWVKDHQVDIDRSEILRVKKNHSNFLKGLELFAGGVAVLGFGVFVLSRLGSRNTETAAHKAAATTAFGAMGIGAGIAFIAAPMEVYGHYTLYKAPKPKRIAPKPATTKPTASGMGSQIAAQLASERAPLGQGLLFAELQEISLPSGAGSARDLRPAAFVQNHAPQATGRLFPIKVGDNLWGCINNKGDIVVEMRPSDPSGYLDVPSTARLCGVAGDAARPTLPKDGFGTLGSFHDGLAIASPGEDTSPSLGELDGMLPATYLRVKKGYINPSGRYVIPPKYVDLDQFSEGFAAVRIGRHKWAYIDTTGKQVIPKTFYMAGRFSEGLAPVAISDFWKGNKVGFIDKTGRVVIPPKFDRARSFAEGLARVEIAGKWGYVDKTGKMVINASFDLAGDFSEGLAAVNIGAAEDHKKDWRASVNCCMPGEQKEDILVRAMISGSNSIYPSRTPLFWDDFSVFNPWCFRPSGFYSDGTAQSVGGEWGYIDRNGKTVIRPQFSGALEFSDGLAQVFAPATCSSTSGPWVSPAQKFGYIDETGKFVWRPTDWPKD